MKNKRGFTLIELLAVIVIIAILATVTVIIVDNTFKKANNSVSKMDKKAIEEATKIYVTENLSANQKEALNSDQQIEITYEDLVEAGLVSNKDKDVSIIIDKDDLSKSLSPSNTNISVIVGLTLKRSILNTETVETKAPAFTTTSTDKGLFVQKDDTTKSIGGQATYYYRGNVTNNFLKFKNDSTNKLWRIIRINENGTIRIITNSVLSNINYGAATVYNTSNVKTTVDNYYNSLSPEIKNIIVSDDFCGEITTPSFGAIPRLTTNPVTPSFTCTSSMTNMTAGLISADEVVYAGGLIGTSVTGNRTYLNGNIFYWTMTPGYIGVPYNLFSADLSYFSTLQAVGNMGVRPVVNLKSTVISSHSGAGTTGNPGTSTNPYIVE